MKGRCGSKTHVDYPRYGGRGIEVCGEWHNFENFYQDMYNAWLEHKKTNKFTSIERIDVDSGYSKTNCRWANKKEQANNRRHHKILSFRGKRLNLVQWAEHLGIKRSTLSQRIYVYKWPIEKALTYNVS